MARPRKIGNTDDTIELVIIGGIAVGGYLFVIKPLMNAFSSVTPAQQALLDSVTNTPPNSSPFNYQYGDIANDYNGFSGTYSSNQDLFTNIKSVYDNFVSQGQNPSIGSDDYENAYVWGEALNNAFKWYYVDVNAVLQTFAQFQNKTDVANTAAYLYYNYGKDLVTLVTHGVGPLPQIFNGIPLSNWLTIIQNVNSLPA